MSMFITNEDRQGIEFVKITGDIDLASTEYFEETLSSVLQKNNTHLVFDFSECSHVTSKVIGLVMWAKAEAVGSSGDVLLLNPHPKLLSLIKLIGLGDVLKTVTSPEEAIKLLA
ncbi:MAG: STAS domain-containing protein [Planctomycetota bacterium]|jgi:anti-anti-sigma factor